MATVYAVGERVALDMAGAFGRRRREWRELSEYERAAWLIYDEADRLGEIWDN